MRKKPQDAIYLDRTGLIILFSILTIAAAFLSWRLLKSAGDNDRATVNIESERERDAVPYEVIERRASRTGSNEGGETDIGVSCATDSKALAATIKNALLEMYDSHPDHTCHKVNVFLKGLWPPSCLSVAEGYLCRKGHMVDGLRAAPWDIHAWLISREEWPDRDDASLVRLCREIEQSGVCPWEAPLNEQEAVAKVASALAVTKVEAKRILEDGRRFATGNYFYRQELRRRRN